MKPLLYHPEALGELQEAPQYYYKNDSIRAGDALVAELNSALEQIAEHPSRWKKILADVRAYGPTRKFKWRIAYLERSRDVFVIAAYYGGVEDPIYWIERLAS
jgi:plasmid stabilization system protein ParE